MGDDPEPLRLPFLKPGRKEVRLSTELRVKSDLSEEAQEDFLALRKILESGMPVPGRYYRKHAAPTPDQLLDEDGFMHLHLVHQGSDDLVFLIQFEEFIYIFEIGSHAEFGAEGRRALKTRHTTQLRAIQKELRQLRAEKAKAKEDGERDKADRLANAISDLKRQRLEKLKKP